MDNNEWSLNLNYHLNLNCHLFIINTLGQGSAYRSACDNISGLTTWLRLTSGDSYCLGNHSDKVSGKPF